MKIQLLFGFFYLGNFNKIIDISSKTFYSVIKMFNDDKSLYSIGVVADILGEHPETLRVWEKNGLIKPDRSSYQRKYTTNDIKRLQFIKYLIDEKGFNVASLAHLISMYPCYYNYNCLGGDKPCNNKKVNTHKPCWKSQGCYCVKIYDKSDMCCMCKKNESTQKE